MSIVLCGTRLRKRCESGKERRCIVNSDIAKPPECLTASGVRACDAPLVDSCSSVRCRLGISRLLLDIFNVKAEMEASQELLP